MHIVRLRGYIVVVVTSSAILDAASSRCIKSHRCRNVPNSKSMIPEDGVGARAGSGGGSVLVRSSRLVVAETRNVHA